MTLVVALARIRAAPAGSRSAGWRSLQGRLGRRLACEAAARVNRSKAMHFEVTNSADSGPVVATCPEHALGTVVGITHSGSWVCGAAARGLARLGIDVQVAEPRDVAQLARFMNWNQLVGPLVDPAEDRDRFTHLWTLWEAAVKVDCRTVLAGTTPAFESLAPRCRPGSEQSWSAGGYSAQSLRLDAGHWLTVIAPSMELPLLEFHRCDELAGAEGAA
ncbi:MAG: hypothetical protein ABL989_04165 [Gammaproteobacteria bacterium]